ncbi:MAG TPA: alkaline phosphatase family protein [Gemmatimonadales bacterium]|nr:alkaline phosphatase family protein [Gemmatimonadales bacterium]
MILLSVLPGVAAAQGPVSRPRLVVVIVIDQFRPEYLQRFKPYFGSGGFNLFLGRGATYTEAEYQHAVTFTCPGHAVVLTGTHANVNGIVANQWYDQRSGRPQYCAADTLVSLIGSSGPGRSPRNLIGPTVGDELKRVNQGRSRVITIAGKDRSAILLGGHRADASYWMADSLFVTSSYYMNELPGWVRAFNASGRVSSYTRKTWTRILPRAAYTAVGRDDVAWEENVAGMGRTFPHPLPPDSSSRFMDAFRSSPFQNEVLLEFAMAAVSAEGLGRDSIPDLLGVSLSANDLVGHAFGPNSHEIMDMTVRTDRVLQRFFNYLDKRIGLRHLLIVLTADHGVAPLPETMQELSADAGRIDPARIAAATEAALQSRFGTVEAPGWLVHLTPPWIYLNVKALRQRGIPIEAAERTARDAAESVPGVHRALTATELRQQQANGMASGAVLSFHPERSGNVYYELKPYIVSGQEPSGTTHGSPWSYDVRVPLLWFGASVKRGVHVRPVSVADIAPTLAAFLGIGPLPGFQGKILEEVVTP